jgi:glycine/serine hydroxymethyltransferase
VSARLSAVALVVGALLVTGWAHPLGLVAGLSVLPPVLVVVGLRDARIAS